MSTSQASYRAPLLHRGAHFSTIIPNRLRKVRDIRYARQRFELEDKDFIDIDFHHCGSNEVALLLHGLEGSSASQYMLGMATALEEIGIDSAAMNFRGCSGVPNRVAMSYHSGKTDDVREVVSGLADRYDRIYVIGFSLGGNVALKLAGEWEGGTPKSVAAVAGISVPCDLASSGQTLQHWQNRIYLRRFLNQLKGKALEKAARFPALDLDKQALEQAQSLKAFDDIYTAPVHGFDSATDYYDQCSSNAFIPSIRLPTLIINAQNDSFLSPACYPYEHAAENAWVTLLTPRHGGHVGFANDHWMQRTFWHELQVQQFISAVPSMNR